ncbi:hypothetical protein MnTg02_00879 [bacterium MnTg02]|nr:hypothetical protein MnTg02_00879 [bacterium MnTg02]
MLLDGKSGNRLSGFSDAIDNALGPAGLDADNDGGGNVRISARTDHRAKMQIKVLAELQAAIRVGKG